MHAAVSEPDPQLRHGHQTVCDRLPDQVRDGQVHADQPADFRDVAEHGTGVKFEVAVELRI